MSKPKNLGYFPHSVKVNPNVVDHPVLHEIDQLLVHLHIRHGIKWFFLSLFFLLIVPPMLWNAYTADKVRPGYTLNGRSVTFMTKAELENKLANEQASLIVEVPSKNAQVQADILLKSEDAGLTYNTKSTVEAVFRPAAGIRHFYFLSDIQRAFDKREIPRRYSYNEEKFNIIVDALTEALNWDPKNAVVQFNGANFEAFADINGSSITREAVMAGLSRTFTYGEAVFDPPAASPEAKIKLPQAQVAAEEADKMIKKDIKIAVFGQNIAPTVKERSLWLAFAEVEEGTELKGNFDRNLIHIYLEELNKKYTDGRRFIDINPAIDRVIGVMSDPNPANAAVDLPTLKRATTPPSPWPKYVEVNLSEQHMYAVENGRIVNESGTVTGAPATPTNPGIFHIYQKQNNKYFATADGFRGSSKYWMRFDDGRGLHDANWRREWEFGNQARRKCCGSHGCINLPIPTAAWLYGWTSIGTPVWVHN